MALWPRVRKSNKPPPKTRAHHNNPRHYAAILKLPHRPLSKRKLNFRTVAKRLPLELVSIALGHWTSPQTIVVSSPAFHYRPYHVSYHSETDAFSFELPYYLRLEYNRLRRQSWRDSTKLFTYPADFYLAHYFLTQSVQDPLPSHEYDNLSTKIVRKCRITSTQDAARGLGKIHLDFTAAQYFAMFNVKVPPFDWVGPPDVLYRDSMCHGAAVFLKGTKELTLCFGEKYKAANAWTEIDAVDPRWKEAVHRGKVCESGQVIDWILSFAWKDELLQHIPKITITADVQPWVLTKWHNIFASHTAYLASLSPAESPDPFAVHKPNIKAFMELGAAQTPSGESWSPELHYPPLCTCAMGCWRLVGGNVEADVVVKTWEEVGWAEADDKEVVGEWDGETSAWEEGLGAAVW